MIYEVSGVSTGFADLTYTNSQGNSTQAVDAPLPQSVPVQRLTGAFYYMSAQNTSNFLTSSITVTVVTDGSQICQNTSTGPGAIADCTGSVP